MINKILLIAVLILFLISTQILIGNMNTRSLLHEIKQDVSNLTIETNTFHYLENYTTYELVNETHNYDVVEQYHFNRKDESFCSGKRISSMTKLFIYGNSMNPTIFHDDDVFVAEFKRAQNPKDYIQEGDILAVYTNDTKEEIVVHRLVGIYPDHFIMKGDNNPRFDGDWADYDLIMGVVCAWQRK
jgi:hypothetical protein